MFTYDPVEDELAKRRLLKQDEERRRVFNAERAKNERHEMWGYLLETRAAFDTDKEFFYWCDVMGYEVIVNEEIANGHG